MDDVIEWLNSEEGIEWSKNHFKKPRSQCHRMGRLFTLEPAVGGIFPNKAYTPISDERIRNEFVPKLRWIYEPETMEGMSGPA